MMTRDRLALRQDANHQARLPATWGIHRMHHECVRCGWPVRLVADRRASIIGEDTIVYVARHGDPLGRLVRYPDVVWLTDSRTSTTKRHIEACPLVKRSGKKLHAESLAKVWGFPVCKACLELLDSGEEQGEEATLDL